MFPEKKFIILALVGISQKTIDEHLKLYAGYVKHANLIQEKIKEYSQTPEDAEKNAYAISEIQRRFGFEFDGMRNHEYYFEQLEHGPTPIDSSSNLYKRISDTWGNFDAWMNRFKSIAMTRGIGWAILCYDPKQDVLVQTWVDEQHLGHLNGLVFLYGIDMWEHSYMLDYLPSEKKKYIDAYLANTNWKVVEKRFI